MYILYISPTLTFTYRVQ